MATEILDEELHPPWRLGPLKALHDLGELEAARLLLLEAHPGHSEERCQCLEILRARGAAGARRDEFRGQVQEAARGD